MRLISYINQKILFDDIKEVSELAFDVICGHYFVYVSYFGKQEKTKFILQREHESIDEKKALKRRRKLMYKILDKDFIEEIRLQNYRFTPEQIKSFYCRISDDTYFKLFLQTSDTIFVFYFRTENELNEAGSYLSDFEINKGLFDLGLHITVVDRYNLAGQDFYGYELNPNHFHNVSPVFSFQGNVGYHHIYLLKSDKNSCLRISFNELDFANHAREILSSMFKIDGVEKIDFSNPVYLNPSKIINVSRDWFWFKGFPFNRPEIIELYFQSVPTLRKVSIYIRGAKGSPFNKRFLYPADKVEQAKEDFFYLKNVSGVTPNFVFRPEKFKFTECHVTDFETVPCLMENYVNVVDIQGFPVNLNHIENIYEESGVIAGDTKTITIEIAGEIEFKPRSKKDFDALEKIRKHLSR